MEKTPINTPGYRTFAEVVASLPYLFLIAFYSPVVAVRVLYGRWPTYNNPDIDSAWLSACGLMQLGLFLANIAGFFAFIILSFRWRPSYRLPGILYVIGTAAMCFVLIYDPAGFREWLLD